MFYYTSTRAGASKAFQPTEAKRLAAYLRIVDYRWTKGQLQTYLLDYRTEDGSRLLLNHLYPLFMSINDAYGDPSGTIAKLLED